MEKRGAVTASSPAAAEAGAKILRGSGNAVDAAVAAALASCVADGCNTGLGGYGGHMVVAPPDGEPVCVDFNMWVPAAAGGAYRGEHLNGPAASVIPNVPAGLTRALDELGTLDWAAASVPALELAADGVEATPTIASAFEEVTKADFVAECFAFEETRPREEGKASFRFRQPALARTLEQMTAHGPEWFYEGPIGDAAIRILQDNGNAVTRAHWAEAPQAVTMAPAPHMEIGNVALSSAPLGTSGSLCMFAAAAAGADLAETQDLETPETIRAWARRIAAAWSYRFGTEDGNAIDTDGLEAWVERALAYEPSLETAAGTGHTCHLNTADGDGTLVAVTLTHGPAWFGARWAVPGTGVVMNTGAHLLCDAKPRIVGERAYGVTNMTPTVARTKEGARIAAGCPGARRIPSIVALVLSRHLFAGAELQEAVARGRFHAESRKLATLEMTRFDSPVAEALREGFDEVGEETPGGYYGPFTAIRREADGRITLGVDDRWPGYSAFPS